MNIFDKLWSKLFDTPGFLVHKEELSVVKAETSTIKTDVNEIKTNVVTMLADLAELKTNLAAIVPIIAGIAAQFPVTADLGTVPAELEALGMPDMSVWLECVGDAKMDEVVEVDIWSKFTVGAEVTAVGLRVEYDPAHFSFLEGQQVRGEDVIDWGGFDIIENSPGQLTFGAYAGSARGIVGDKPVHLASFKVQVTTTNFVSSTIQVNSYVDSLADCRPLPAIAEILLNEN